MPKITLHIEMDSFEEARDFFSVRAAAPKVPEAPVTLKTQPLPATAAPSAAVTATAAALTPLASASPSNGAVPAEHLATMVAAAGDGLAPKRKETTDAMMAYVARGAGRSAKTAKEIQVNAGVNKGIREATSEQLDNLLLAYTNG